jgi:Golgi to ER traffic protein 4
LCRDVDHIALTINEISKNAYQRSEADLFVARSMFELYSRTDNFALARRLRHEYFPDMKSPLLNLADMLPEVIELKDFGLYKDIITKYDPQIKRDPNFIAVSSQIKSQ